MGRRVDFKSRSQLMVALQTETFVVALQGRLRRRPRVESRGLATDLLLAILAGTSDECLRLAGLVLLAGIRGVALLCASVLARFADFTTWLQAVCPGDPYVFALPGSVAVFLALMSAALERLAARQATSGLFEPARLVLQDLLSTNARLLHQKRGTLGTVHHPGDTGAQHWDVRKREPCCTETGTEVACCRRAVEGGGRYARKRN